MIWAGIGYNGKTDIVLVEGRMNATAYRNLIQQIKKQYAVHIVGSSNLILR